MLSCWAQNKLGAIRDANADNRTQLARGPGMRFAHCIEIFCSMFKY